MCDGVVDIQMFVWLVCLQTGFLCFHSVLTSIEIQRCWFSEASDFVVQSAQKSRRSAPKSCLPLAPRARSGEATTGEAGAGMS